MEYRIVWKSQNLSVKLVQYKRKIPWSKFSFHDEYLKTSAFEVAKNFYLDTKGHYWQQNLREFDSKGIWIPSQGELFPKQLAYKRFFEIWGKSNKKLYSRGLLASEKLLQSFAGITGRLNSDRKIEKNLNGDWEPRESLENIYPEYRSLPKIGVTKAQQLARKLNRRK